MMKLLRFGFGPGVTGREVASCFSCWVLPFENRLAMKLAMLADADADDAAASVNDWLLYERNQTVSGICKIEMAATRDVEKGWWILLLADDAEG